MKDAIDRLESIGLLRVVDLALARLFAQKTGRDGDLVGFAAALASAALAQGHSCLPLASLHDFVAGLVAEKEQARVTEEWPSVESVRDALMVSPLVARDAAAAAALVLDADERLYLRRYFVYEQTVAQALAARLPQTSANDVHAQVDHGGLRSALDRLFADDARNGRAADVDQRTAVLLAMRSRLLIISGGPGSGKTTTVLKLLEFAVAQVQAAGLASPRIALAAPTGKAAARLSETLRARGEGGANDSIPRAATTVHRLLGISADGRRVRHDRENPLPYDVIVIDEASMLDLALAARLCAALAPSARLILLGDRDQLAAVEAGRVFGALSHAAGAVGGYSPALAEWLGSILSTEVATAARSTPLADAFVELRGNHRFNALGAIGRLAVALRRGDADSALRILGEGGGEAGMTAVSVAAAPQRVLREFAPRYADIAKATSAEAAFAIADRFRVLCAVREGSFGSTAINAAIERELRRGIAAEEWYPGRLVIVGANDYRLGLFNGDVGIALATGADGALEVWFRNADGSLRALPPLVLSACEPAYALTVHKAQGSEFDEVAVVLPERGARVLTRELIYTAVTRARTKVDLWTSGEILTAAIERSVQRWSGLAEAVGSARAGA